MHHGERVGICGRTGAGKSSVLAALLRLCPIESGRITLNGGNISNISHQMLRSSFGIVPQAPLLFSGSIVENLDPTGSCAMPDLVAALQAVKLWEPLMAAVQQSAISIVDDQSSSDNITRPNLPSTSDSRIDACSAEETLSTEPDTALHAKGDRPCDPQTLSSSRDVLAVAALSLQVGGMQGVNLSLGQKQLLSLARMLLQRRKVMLLDEFTASLDDDTAEILHTLVMQQAAGCAVLQIAHDLKAIQNYDTVIVLGDGRIVDVGNPDILLKDKSSQFALLHSFAQE